MRRGSAQPSAPFGAEAGSELKDFGGTARIVDPVETLARLDRARRLAGISRLANVTGLDCVGVPTWMAVRPLARSVTVSQGKGITHASARVSATMEAIEVFHAEHLVPGGRTFQLVEAARRTDFVDLAHLPIRPKANVSPAKAVAWVAGKCLVSGRTYWLPRQIMDLDLVQRAEEDYLFASSSNGLASGNSPDEAKIHAICEVVERDHTAFWFIDQTLDPFSSDRRLATDTIDEPTCLALLSKIRAAGLQLAIWNLTSDIGLPCFSCTVYDNRRSTLYPTRVSGAGCHPLRHIALARAITEALQSRLSFVAGARDDLFWRTYSDDIPADTVGNQTWLDEHCSGAGSEDYRKIETFGSGDMNSGIVLEEILNSLAAAGFGTVIATDLSSPQIGIPVVHVFIPGMEPHLRAGDYTPGPRMVAHLRDIMH